MTERTSGVLLTPQKRVIILGASNVTRSFGTAVSIARDFWSEPLEIVSAHGHGRSYGSDWSRVLARKLPGILHCELWDRLRSRGDEPRETSAIVTDIGNDILYEFDVPTIASWVERCLDRLADAGAQTVVAGLPIENIFGLSEIRYKFFRSLFVPGCSLSLKETADRAIGLNERVSALAKARGMQVLMPAKHWYGLDPIHIRFQHYAKAWNTIFTCGLRANENRIISRVKLSQALYLRTRAPARIRWFNREYQVAQPCVRFADGTSVSMY